MAHECFSCGSECYCSGDIDDCIVSLTPSKCKGCGCEDWNYSALVILANCSSCNEKKELVETFIDGEPNGDYCYECCEEEGFVGVVVIFQAVTMPLIPPKWVLIAKVVKTKLETHVISVCPCAVAHNVSGLVAGGGFKALLLERPPI